MSEEPVGTSKCNKEIPATPQALLAVFISLGAGWDVPTDPAPREALLPALGTGGPAGGAEGRGLAAVADKKKGLLGP